MSLLARIKRLWQLSGSVEQVFGRMSSIEDRLEKVLDELERPSSIVPANFAPKVEELVPESKPKGQARVVEPNPIEQFPIEENDGPIEDQG